MIPSAPGPITHGRVEVTGRLVDQPCLAPVAVICTFCRQVWWVVPGDAAKPCPNVHCAQPVRRLLAEDVASAPGGA